jgi:hypothetical protein
MIEFKEKAFFLGENMRELDHGEFGYLYIGNEFCERLLPSLTELDEAVSLYIPKKLKLALVTPYLTDRGIDMFVKAIDFMQKKSVDCELVVNDLGALRMLQGHHRKHKLILGRILVSQYLSILHSRQDKKGLNCSFPENFLFFLKANNVSCLEFNNYYHLACVQEQVKGFGFGCHIYYPFEYLTTSRYCGYVESVPFYMHSATQDCGKRCKKYIAFKKSRLLGGKVIIKGNTHFIKQTQDLPDLKCAVDRIIYNDFFGK